MTCRFITLLLPLLLALLVCQFGHGFIIITGNEPYPHEIRNVRTGTVRVPLVEKDSIRSSSSNPHDFYHTRRKSTHLSLFWSSGDSDTKKKKKKGRDEMQKITQNTKETSKMGTTATTMENFKQSQELGKKTSSLVQELSSIQVEGVAAKGKIKVLVDGQQQPTGVEIDEEYFKQGGVEDFSEALLVAMQDAHSKSMHVMQDRMQGLYSDLGLPPSK